MKILVTVFLLTTVLTSAALIRGAAAQSVSSNLPEDASLSIDATLDKFDQLYQRELGSTRGCQQPELQMFKVCSDVLRNDGNGPFILHHNHVTDKVVVLFHGLSDSPFYLKSIAKALHQQGYNVVVGLLPGHGKKYADKDMQDRSLSSRWRQHVSELVQLSRHLGTKTDIGGFSTGGILAIEYALLNPQSVHALVLFSGALALNDSVETLSKVWGVQSLLKWYDGEYSTAGPNKYKYPGVARFTVVELMEVILSVRELIDKQEPNLPIFAAHSAADKTTPIKGVKALLAINKGDSTLFEIGEEYDLCHGDLVLDQAQYLEVKYDLPPQQIDKHCKPPLANPQHSQMVKALLAFMDAH